MTTAEAVAAIDEMLTFCDADGEADDAARHKIEALLQRIEAAFPSGDVRVQCASIRGAADALFDERADGRRDLDQVRGEVCADLKVLRTVVERVAEAQGRSPL
jgi:hypothetical protein